MSASSAKRLARAPLLCGLGLGLAGLIAVVVAAVFVMQLPSEEERLLIGYWRIYDQEGVYEQDVHFASRRSVRTRIGDGTYETIPCTWWIADGELRLRDPLSTTDWFNVIFNDGREILSGWSEGELKFVSGDELQLRDVDSATVGTLKRITATTAPATRVDEETDE